MKINLKLLLIFLEIALIPLIFLGFVSYSNSQKEITNQIISKLESIADIQKSRFENRNRENIERLVLLTSRTQLRIETESYIRKPNSVSQEKITNILKDAIKSITGIKESSVIDLNGIVIASTNPLLIGSNLQSTKYFQDGKTKNSTTNFIKNNSGEVRLFLSGPLTLNEKIIGVLVVNSDGSNIRSVVSNYVGLGETGETLLVKKNENGDAVFLSPTRFDPNAALTKIISKEKTNIPAVHAILGEEIIMKDATDYAGTSVIAVTRYIPQLGWGVVAKINQKEAYIPIEKLKNLLIFIVVISLLIIVIISFSLAKSFTDPIKKLTHYAKLISSGDLSRKIQITSNDEIGILAETFNEMSGKLQSMYQNLEVQIANRTKELKNKVDELETTKKGVLNILEDLQLEKAKSEEQKNVLSSFLENMPIGAVLLEAPTGKITMINRAGTELLGRGVMPNATKEKYTEVYDLLKPDGNPYSPEENPAAITLATGKSSTKDDIFIRKPDGTKINIRGTTAPIKSQKGELVLVVGVFEDITKEKELEKLKDEFVSLASHELRTPMTAIKGMISMMLEGDYGEVNQSLKEPLLDTLTSTDRLIHLVNDMLSVSRIEAGRMKFTLSEFSVAEVAGQVVKMLQPVALEKNITLESRDLATVSVQADTDKVVQILSNLIGNSLKFTDSGGITITSKVENESIIIYVTDTGMGIAKESQHKLFGKFQQVDSKQQGRPAGTGLGLYISREMVRKMGGDLWIDATEEGKGSTFAFSLPLATSQIAQKIKAEYNKDNPLENQTKP